MGGNLVRVVRVVLVASCLVTCGARSAMAFDGGGGAESKRLARAKDFIAEEQWSRAIEELQAAARDPKETTKDEILFWLAHSQSQAGDSASSLSTISRLERSHPSSPWVKPARALRLELAVRLGRSDVLWFTAAPAPPRPASAPAAPHPTPHARPTPPAPPAPPAPAPPATPPGAPQAAISATVRFWIPANYHPDLELRIEALRHLIQVDASKAIPMLKEIALETDNPASAGRALFVLAQSGRPEAQDTVVHLARTGASSVVRVAAVREIGRFGGPDAAQELLRVYSTGDEAVRLQVVRSLGERWERTPLLNIVQTEKDVELRSRAIMMLGRAGGSSELRSLYTRVTPPMKRSIILSLFNARADGDLIQIAERERDAALREETLTHLRLLGTPQAKAYLQKVSDKR
jgi:hypothetical protein